MENPFQPYDLTQLIGAWRGEGAGEYPTIDSFLYREELDITVDPLRGYLNYTQNTLLLNPDGSVLRPTHWETGLIRPHETNGIMLASLHINARMEVLEGKITLYEKGSLSIDFQSEFLANDARMIRSSRRWTLDGDMLDYDMHMATDRVPGGALHLKGTLYRRGQS